MVDNSGGDTIPGTIDDGLWHLSQNRGSDPGHTRDTSFYYGNEPTPLPANTHGVGTLAPGGDEDVWQRSGVTAGQQAFVYADMFGGDDGFLRLFADDGSFIESDDDDGPPGGFDSPVVAGDSGADLVEWRSPELPGPHNSQAPPAK